MYHHRAGVPIRLLFLFVFTIGVFVVCSNGTDQSDKQLVSGDPSVEQTDSALIEKTIKGVWVRWNHRDFAALYDMEFEYVQDRYTFDQYLELPQIKNGIVDSFYDFKVKGLQMFDHDSALVDNIVMFKGPSGKISEVRRKDMMYFYKGRWIRPSVGVSSLQWHYDEMIRKADSAAAAEEAEGLNN